MQHEPGTASPEKRRAPGVAHRLSRRAETDILTDVPHHPKEPIMPEEHVYLGARFRSDPTDGEFKKRLPDDPGSAARFGEWNLDPVEAAIEMLDSMRD